MRFIADLHIHSHYSRATSKLLTPVYLDYWARVKGITVVGTGDFTHPGWLKELKDALEPAEDGLYKLKDELKLEVPVKNTTEVRFLLSTEISNIYKKKGKVRKIHNVVLAPDFETVEKIQKEFERRKFNITSDGRPTIGFDARDLLELLLEIDERIFFIPAHIWTPWFAVLGSKSGFDSIDECFEDMTKYIYAVETGLSSDQPLNWLCSFLDKFNLVSNSDAHSPEKLGRNANIFNTELAYYDIIEAMKSQTDNRLEATIDMYPQEGKYHYDGHRACGVRFDPVQTLEHNGICPVCGKPLTIGVAHRIASLADRDDPLQRPHRKNFYYIIPLKEILAEINKTSANTKKIDNLYFKLISQLGTEFDILQNVDLQDIRKAGGELLAEAIRRMRNGEVITEQGFDGQYGVIRLFEPGEIDKFGATGLFSINKEKTTYRQRPLLEFDIKRFRQLKQQQAKTLNTTSTTLPASQPILNDEQQKAVNHLQGPALVISGPGTGKTRVLTYRIVNLIKKHKIAPNSILAITFTNQAANEMKKRLTQLLDEKSTEKITVSTFHSFGLFILKQVLQKRFSIIDENDKQEILKLLKVPKNRINSFATKISNIKNKFLLTEQIEDQELKQVFEKYQNYLEQNKLFDFDDLIYKTVLYLLADNEAVNYLRSVYKWLLIDEFQDINSAQYELIKLLAPPPSSNIFAIGDPNQAIYGFRGADNSLIQQFKNEYKPTIYTISTSYRVPQTILKASTSILNTQAEFKGLSEGLKINISEHPTDKSEAEFIARQIEALIGGTRFFSIDSKVTTGTEQTDIHSFADFAILTRTRQQFDTIIKALNDHGIPYQVIGTEPFYIYPPYSQIIDALKYLIGFRTDFLKQKLSGYLHALDLIKLQDSPSKIIQDVAKIMGIKQEQIKQLLELASDYTDLQQFLENLELRTGQDDYNPELQVVSLMTLHASKGLEFKAVFIPGVEDGLIPYTIYREDVDIEEERRLLYVGMTRAKKYLFLSYAKKREFLGRVWNLPPSRFLKSIEDDLFEHQEVKLKPKPKDRQLSLF